MRRRYRFSGEDHGDAYISLREETSRRAVAMNKVSVFKIGKMCKTSEENIIREF